MKFLKKIFKSPVLRLILSIALIYLAFKKVDVDSVITGLKEIDFWFVVVNIIISLAFVVLISFRWSLLLLEKSGIKDAINFARSTLMASFYGLFLPTMVGVDVLRWLMINNRYPKISKAKVLGSVFLDRFIALSVYMFVGSIFIFIAKTKGFFIPNLVLFLVLGIATICLVFYIAIAFFNLEKIFEFNFLKRFKSMAELIKKEGFKRILRGMVISLLSELGWLLHLWFISWYLKTGLDIFSILIFMPVISVILILPISIAGFGAREQLYLFFFSKDGDLDERLLLMSAFSGVLAVINALMGGLVTLTGDFKRLKEKIV